MTEDQFKDELQSAGSVATKKSAHFNQAKSRLLEAATEYLLSVGLANWSYRGCSRALGVSSNTLNYYFKSKDFLLAEILESMRRRDLPLLDTFKEVETDQFMELALAFWDVMSDVKQFPLGMAQFELYTLAMRDPDKYSTVMESEQLWIDGIKSILEKANYPEDELASASRLVIWTYRGLYLSLLASDHTQASNDRARSAFKELIRLLVAQFPKTKRA
ncbi:MAG: TetR/AcrR family transcriptional regulator [Acidimicrobiaceae bacterium]|nr:TetR/AcrR family transcriptional regulator [Acidimicrobiaceae bacterium]